MPTTRMTKAQAIAVKQLTDTEEALLKGDWAAARDAAIKLAALAADRASKK
jgi:hypothetical protein